MATDTDPKSVHKTLTTTAADFITITGYDDVEIINHDSANWIYFRSDGVTAVAEADGTDVVAPAGFVRHNADGREVSLVGNGNAYSVVGVSA